MPMTRKDYNMFAYELKQSDIDMKTCIKIANILDRNYSNFNYDKFVRACQKESK